VLACYVDLRRTLKEPTEVGGTRKQDEDQMRREPRIALVSRPHLAPNGADVGRIFFPGAAQPAWYGEC